MDRRSPFARIAALATALLLVTGFDPCFVRVLAGDSAMACVLVSGAAAPAAAARPMHACCAKAMHARAHAAGTGTRARGTCCQLQGLASSAAVPAHALHAGDPTPAVAIAPAPAVPAPSAARLRSVPGDDEPPGRGAVAAIRGRAPPLSR